MARRLRRRASVRSNGRQGLWFRYGRFTATQIGGASPLVYQNSIVTEDMWRRDDDSFTQPKRGAGGPLLTSLFGNFHFRGRFDDTTDPTADFELLVWEEAVGSPPIATAPDFYAKMDNEHVLHYSYVVGKTVITNATNNISTLTVSKSFRVKTKTRLSGRVVMFAVRCSATGALLTTRELIGSVSGYITTP